MKMKNFSKIDVVKIIAGGVISIGVGAIVSSAIKSVSPEASNIFKKACIGIGGAVISGMVSSHACKYADERIDEVVNMYNDAKKNIEMVSNEQEI